MKYDGTGRFHHISYKGPERKSKSKKVIKKGGKGISTYKSFAFSKAVIKIFFGSCFGSW